MSKGPMRRAKGSGSVRPRGRGSWEVRYDGLPDIAGDTNKIYETVRGSRRDAERLLRERLGEVEDGSYVLRSKETVAEFMQHWLATYVVTNTTPSTQRGYQGVARRYISPILGRIPLQNLQPQHIQKLYAAMLERGLSAQTVQHTHRVLRQALGHAVKWSVINKNPADVADPPRPEKKELEMWDVETIQSFLNAANGSPYRDVYHLAVLTGMRRSELLGLQWNNVDLDSSKLAVVTTLQRINGRGLVIGGPKTQKSRRSIALGTTTVGLLKSVRTRQIEQRLAVGSLWQDGGYVFTQTDGKPMHPDKVSNEFRKIVDKSGLPHLTLHGLRHAHATLLFLEGVHPKVVSERLGHSNISVTLDIYSHVMPGMQEAAAQALDERLTTGGF